MKFYKKEEIDRVNVLIVADNFDKLPDYLRNSLLLKLSKNNEVARSVAWVLTDNYGKLPEETRSELLVILSQKRDTSKAILNIIANNYDKLSESIRSELLFKLSEMDETPKTISEGTTDKFLRFIFAKKIIRTGKDIYGSPIAEYYEELKKKTVKKLTAKEYQHLSMLKKIEFEKKYPQKANSRIAMPISKVFTIHSILPNLYSKPNIKLTKIFSFIVILSILFFGCIFLINLKVRF